VSIKKKGVSVKDTVATEIMAEIREPLSLSNICAAARSAWANKYENRILVGSHASRSCGSGSANALLWFSL